MFYKKTNTGYDRLKTNEEIEVKQTTMKASEYIKKCAKGFGFSVEEITEARKDKSLERIKEMIKDGKQLWMPYLYYQKTGFAQEGLHRAMAILELKGDIDIPVLFMSDK